MELIWKKVYFVVYVNKILVRKIYRVSFDKNKMPKSFSDIKKNGVEFKNIEAPMMFHYIDSNSYTDMNVSKLLIAYKTINLGTWRIKILEEIQYLLKKRR